MKMHSACLRSIQYGAILFFLGVSPCVAFANQNPNPSTSAKAGSSSRGAELYKARCAVCHDKGGRLGPSRQVLKSLTADAILATLRTGQMQAQAKGLSLAELQAIAEFLGSSAHAPAIPKGFCRSPISWQTSKPGWNGWGGDLGNRRFQESAEAGLSAEQVPHLRLRWAFAFPGVNTSYAQPTVWGGQVFVGSASGAVYALRASTGCISWIFKAHAVVRTAIFVEQSQQSKNISLYFGDQAAWVYALDAKTGKQLWSRLVDRHRSARITGAPALWGDRLYVPVSSLQEETAANPDYACCRFRGKLVALNAQTGAVVWESYTVRREPTPQTWKGKEPASWGPSGAAIWSAPTIDPQGGRVYVATGDNYSAPASESSDAILAIDLKTGKRLWTHQFTKDDAWTGGCLLPSKVNCPESPGPDFDFGASPILTEAGGRQLLLAGQKSGMVFAMDPKTGELVWSRRVGLGGVVGGVEWGMTVDHQHVYVPVSDLYFQPGVAFEHGAFKHLVPINNLGGGLFALLLSTGEIGWYAPPIQACGKHEDCSPAQIAAATAIPGAVFSGSMDGHLRAYSTANGHVLWDFNTARTFSAVNGIRAYGGSVAGPGPVVADGMLFVPSGYPIVGGMPGNVLLAFSPADAAKSTDGAKKAKKAKKPH
jgi:polyvinyl alcohol dehydrogenase (cytochrome)